MHKLALAVLLVAACSKKATDPVKEVPVVEGPTAKAGDPASLPPPGVAPPALDVTTELDPIWTTKLKTLQGKDTTLGELEGKAVLIVNVASKCGLTPQYATLEALQKKYASRGFTVVGFPCNQFGGQEPGTAEEIQTFCSTTYGVTFPIMEKIEVNGEHRHEIYKALTPLKDASGHTGDIRWNFEKFIVSADRKHVTRFAPETKPEDPALIATLENALPKT